jgi:predicted short-subunit dehydrogenase-like oxidoreductase (DUF2520 family)
MNLTAGLVGTGRMAEVLGKSFSQAPNPLLSLRFIVGRNPERTKELSRDLGGEPLGFFEPLPPVDLLWIAVRDDALEEVAESLASASWPEGFPKLVIHGSGARGIQSLRAFGEKGVALGVLHPLFSLQPGMGMEGRVFVLSGDPEARGFLEPLVRSVGARPRFVKDLQSSLYHCAASLLANGTTALFAAGLELLQKASGGVLGAEEGKLLMYASLEALDRGDPAEVLTGPMQRGDLETVARHLASLESQSREQRQLYRALMSFALSLAISAGLGEGIQRDFKLLLRSEECEGFEGGAEEKENHL